MSLSYRLICAALFTSVGLTGCAREGGPVKGGASELPTLDVTH